MSDVLIRLAVPGEFAAIGELREAAYSHDYEISGNYRAAQRDVAQGGVEQEVWVALDQGTAMGFTRLTERETRTVEGHTRPLLAFGYEVDDGTGL
jgi:hypothetical protein